jgi:hypothetical protein
MADGIKPTRIMLEGWAIPDELSIDAVYTGDDADWDEAPGVGGEDQWKQPVRCATTAAITIATALNAGDTLDGVTLAAGDRVLVKDQSTASQNGIYLAGTTPARAADMDEDTEVLGAVVYVIDGTANAATTWAVTNAGATIVDTDAMDWAAFGAPALALNDLTDVNAPTPTDEHVLTWDASTSKWIAAAAPGSSGGDTSGQLVFGWDGGGAAISTAATVDVVAPYTGTITGWTLLGDQSGSAVIDLWSDVYANYPPTVADTITASAKPTATSATSAQSSTLTGWDTALTAGDIIRAKPDSLTAFTRLVLVVAYSRP